MTQEQIEELREKLLKEKERIEGELSEFAKKDPNEEGNWNAKHPDFKDDLVELDEEADEVEEYLVELPLERSLETRLLDINSALKKIKSGEYGKCIECKEEISYERLRANPEAKTCIKHAS